MRLAAISGNRPSGLSANAWGLMPGNSAVCNRRREHLVGGCGSGSDPTRPTLSRVPTCAGDIPQPASKPASSRQAAAGRAQGDELIERSSACNKAGGGRRARARWWWQLWLNDSPACLLSGPVTQTKEGHKQVPQSQALEHGRRRAPLWARGEPRKQFIALNLVGGALAFSSIAAWCWPCLMDASTSRSPRPNLIRPGGGEPDHPAEPGARRQGRATDPALRDLLARHDLVVNLNTNRPAQGNRHEPQQGQEAGLSVSAVVPGFTSTVFLLLAGDYGLWL